MHDTSTLQWLWHVYQHGQAPKPALNSMLSTIYAQNEPSVNFTTLLAASKLPITWTATHDLQYLLLMTWAAILTTHDMSCMQYLLLMTWAPILTTHDMSYNTYHSCHELQFLLLMTWAACNTCYSWHELQYLLLMTWNTVCKISLVNQTAWCHWSALVHVLLLQAWMYVCNKVPPSLHSH